MQEDFWHEKWAKKEIAFHAGQPNPLLVKYFKELSVPAGKRIFLPLCGKTLDIGWLLSQGYAVAGAELSAIAIEELFAEMKIKPKITKVGKMQHYSADSIDMYVGNIFDLSQEQLSKVDAIYDRAALVALPPEMRGEYTRHLRRITGTAPQLLICFEYDQQLVPGPPFSISESEVSQHYQTSYQITNLASVVIEGGLRGSIPAQENVWLLR